MGLYKNTHDKKKFSQELLSFLDIPDIWYSLEALHIIIIDKLYYDINTYEITLNNNFKSFFNISEDKIKLKVLITLIIMKFNKINDIPSTNYFNYYQKPIEITDTSLI